VYNVFRTQQVVYVWLSLALRDNLFVYVVFFVPVTNIDILSESDFSLLKYHYLIMIYINLDQQ